MITCSDNLITSVALLKHQGYCKLNQVYFPDEVTKMLELIKYWHENSPKIEDSYIPRLDKGNKTLYNLQNKDPYFTEMLFKSETIESILVYFLNDIWYKQIPVGQPNYILRAFGARSSMEALPLHIDSFIPHTGDEFIAMQVAIMLEDSTEENGCTIAVPKSHKFGTYAYESPEILKQVVPIEAKAGDVLIWNGATWHGTRANNSGRTRWSIVSTFARWWVKQQFLISEALPYEYFHKLTPKQKSIMGFSSKPFLTENDGIDIKQGYP